MTNSVRHAPISGRTTARSEKIDKQHWHRRLRHRNKTLVNVDRQPLHFREISNVWSFSKEGKGYWGNWDAFFFPFKKRYKGEHLRFINVHKYLKK